MSADDRVVPGHTPTSGSIGPYSTATDMLAALDRREVSSIELVDAHVERIDRHDGLINAFAVRTVERARESAASADRARAAGGPGGRLLGLPMTLKESTQVAGLPQSAGIPELADHRPLADGPVASRVFAAGACLLGTTNISHALDDWQADSPVYGRTNNPWDLGRSPGGSTGGGAAALASGMTPLEIGSDIGGSIRVPAAFCGVYGHRPSSSAVARGGGFPFGDRENPAQVMAVQGPLARSARDIELLFEVVAGPTVDEADGWRLDLPAPRADRLDAFRVAVMPSLPFPAPSAAMQGKVDELAAFLRDAGATVAEAMPDVDPLAYLTDYLTLLTVITSQGQSRDEREATAAAFAGTGDPMWSAMGCGMLIDANELLALLDRREIAREAWRRFFDDWDVVVCPASLDVAFPHDSGEQTARTLAVDDRTVPYISNVVAPMWAIYTGQPSTAFPAGLGSAGLPLGLEAIGPYLGDRTTIAFAALLEREWHAFTPPPGWD